jgi:hypothetical protein
VNRPRHQILSRAGLAGDEHGDVHARRVADDLAHFAHLRAAPEAELVLEPRARVVVGRAAPASPGTGKDALDDILELLGGERIFEEVVGPERGGLDGALDTMAVGEQDDRPRVASLDLESPQELGAVGAVEVQVEEAEHEVVVCQHRQRLVNRGGERRLVSQCGQEASEMALHDGVGLHHEYQALLHGLSRQVTLLG